MKRILTIILLSHALIVGGCASPGLKLVIETPEPAEDFVVLCEWYKSGIMSVFKGGHGTDRYRNDYAVRVAASDEEVDCGVSLTGGDASVDIMHPVYQNIGFTATTNANDSDKLTKVGDVMHVRLSETKLDMLNELEKKFESGGFDNYPNPGAEYARQLPGCGFPHLYFKYYREAKKVVKEVFRRRYHDQILECVRNSTAVQRKYLRGYERIPTAEEYMDGMWNHPKWELWSNE